MYQSTMHDLASIGGANSKRVGDRLSILLSQILWLHTNAEYVARDWLEIQMQAQRPSFNHRLQEHDDVRPQGPPRGHEPLSESPQRITQL
jgi:hypothetical protein